MYNYITLTAVKNYIGGSLSDSTTDDDVLLEMIDWAARLIEWWKGRRYDVRREVRTYDTPQAPATQFGAYSGVYVLGEVPPLRLDDDLLEVVTLTNGDGEALTPADYVLRPDNATPKNRIQLRSGFAWEEGDVGAEQAIELDGLWGYHERYSQAWKRMGTSSAAIDADDAAIVMVDLGTLEAGHLVRMETEMMLIESIDTTSKTIVVERGANGSEAAAHAAGTVSAFQPMGTITQMAMRLVKWRYAQRQVDAFDRTYVMGSGVVTTPTSLPADVRLLLGAQKAVLR